jgi:hypothetical protein
MPNGECTNDTNFRWSAGGAHLRSFSTKVKTVSLLICLIVARFYNKITCVVDDETTSSDVSMKRHKQRVRDWGTLSCGTHGAHANGDKTRGTATIYLIFFTWNIHVPAPVCATKQNGATKDNRHANCALQSKDSCLQDWVMMTITT